MPFKSNKQRRYLWANEPRIAREWTDRYGARGGGIMRVPFNLGSLPHPNYFKLPPFSEGNPYTWTFPTDETTPPDSDTTPPDSDTTPPDSGTGINMGGEDYGDTFGVDPAKLRMPSSYTETPGLPEAYNQLLANRQLTKMGIKNPFANEANLGEAYYGDMYDVNPDLYTQTWRDKIGAGIRSLGYRAGKYMPSAMIGNAISKIFPPNKTALLQKEMLGQGFALDDLGRIVNVSHGKRADGTYGYIDYVTPQNVMAGYRPTKVETFDKRIGKIMGDKSYEKLSDSQKRYITAIEGAKKLWLEANEKSDIRLDDMNKTDFQKQVANIPDYNFQDPADTGPGPEKDDWGSMGDDGMWAKGGLAQRAPRGSYFNGGLASLWRR